MLSRQHWTVQQLLNEQHGPLIQGHHECALRFHQTKHTTSTSPNSQVWSHSLDLRGP